MSSGRQILPSPVSRWNKIDDFSSVLAIPGLGVVIKSFPLIPQTPSSLVFVPGAIVMKNGEEVRVVGGVEAEELRRNGWTEVSQ